MQVLATLPAGRVPRSHAMRNSQAIKPHRDSPVSYAALASLSHALLREDQVAIVRCARALCACACWGLHLRLAPALAA